MQVLSFLEKSPVKFALRIKCNFPNPKVDDSLASSFPCKT